MKCEKWDKEQVFGVIERETGRVHVRHIPKVNRWAITKEIAAVVGPQAKMMTDESALYANLKRRGFEHQIVIHSSKEWVRGECHTQAIDGFWSLLKRGLIGSFHQVSHKHLNRYISELQFRYNNRFEQEIFAAIVINLVSKEALRYKALTAKPMAAPPQGSDDPILDEPF